MERREFLGAGATATVGALAGTQVVGAAPAAADSGPERDSAYREAVRILKRVPLIDGHNDVPWQYRQRVGNRLNEIDLAEDTSTLDPPMHTDIPRLNDGHLGGQFWSVYVSPETTGPEGVKVQLDQLDIARRMFERYDEFEYVTTARGVHEAFANGKLASLLGMEGGHAIDNSLAALRMCYEAGARYLTLTHNDTHDWADAATDEVRHQGLSDFGKEVVREMNWLGMLVDLSHVHELTMHDALDVSEAPVIFSHSSARGQTDHERNVPDDVLDRLPDNGGIVMVTVVPSFVSDEEPATLADVADHIDHIRDRIGTDYIGIGADYDGISEVPEGLEDVSTYPDLFAELIRRGYQRDQLKNIAGLNALRVFGQAEKVSARLRGEREASDVKFEDFEPDRHEDPTAEAPLYAELEER